MTPHFCSVTFVFSVLNLSGKLSFENIRREEGISCASGESGFVYWRISAASETTRSAIARHDVSPGDSIPIN